MIPIHNSVKHFEHTYYVMYTNQRGKGSEYMLVFRNLIELLEDS